jgi:hypothetical protein
MKKSLEINVSNWWSFDLLTLITGCLLGVFNTKNLLDILYRVFRMKVRISVLLSDETIKMPSQFNTHRVHTYGWFSVLGAEAISSTCPFLMLIGREISMLKQIRESTNEWLSPISRSRGSSPTQSTKNWEPPSGSIQWYIARSLTILTTRIVYRQLQKQFQSRFRRVSMIQTLLFCLLLIRILLLWCDNFHAW